MKWHIVLKALVESYRDSSLRRETGFSHAGPSFNLSQENWRAYRYRAPSECSKDPCHPNWKSFTVAHFITESEKKTMDLSHIDLIAKFSLSHGGVEKQNNKKKHRPWPISELRQDRVCRSTSPRFVDTIRCGCCSIVFKFQVIWGLGDVCQKLIYCLETKYIASHRPE